MTGQTPGTPTNQAINNLQQLNLRDNPIAFIKKNYNFLEISDHLKTVCLHGVDIFVTFSHRRKFWCQWNHWGAAGCCVDYQFWTFHHHQHYIALIRFAGSRFVIALLYVDILNTTHHNTPHRLRQKWGKAGEVRAGGDSDSESNHRTNHILILFSDEF